MKIFEIDSFDMFVMLWEVCKIIGKHNLFRLLDAGANKPVMQNTEKHMKLSP